MKGILIEEQGEVYRLIDQKELDEIESSAEEFDGFTGIRIVGRVQPEVKVNFADVEEKLKRATQRCTIGIFSEYAMVEGLIPDTRVIPYKDALRICKELVSKISA